MVSCFGIFDLESARRSPYMPAGSKSNQMQGNVNATCELPLGHRFAIFKRLNLDQDIAVALNSIRLSNDAHSRYSNSRLYASPICPSLAMKLPSVQFLLQRIH